jgi:thioredoxin-like negative regulator of GroEL
MKGQVVFARVDATTESATAEAHAIESFPTIKYFKKGEIVGFNAEATDAETLVEFAKRKMAPQVVHLKTKQEFDSFVFNHNEGAVVASGKRNR